MFLLKCACAITRRRFNDDKTTLCCNKGLSTTTAILYLNISTPLLPLILPFSRGCIHLGVTNDLNRSSNGAFGVVVNFMNKLLELVEANNTCSTRDLIAVGHS